MGGGGHALGATWHAVTRALATGLHAGSSALKERGGLEHCHVALPRVTACHVARTSYADSATCNGGVALQAEEER